MRKAKAFFAAVVIIIVAGASAAVWYMNEKGYIGKNSNQISSEAFENSIDYSADTDIKSDDAERTDKVPANKTDENITAKPNENYTKNTQKDNRDTPNINESDINEFLSVFSRVYFAENKDYSCDKYSDYEVIRFAYSHIFRTERSSVITRQTDDNIGSYFGVPYDKVNEVLEEYLGITADREGVYTEKPYEFFNYDNGYFYTPAAEGLGFQNLAIADSIRKKDESDNLYEISFTVYSSSVNCDMSSEEAKEKGEKYAAGKAEIEITDGNYILKSYAIK